MVSEKDLEPYKELYGAILDLAIHDATREPLPYIKYPKNHILTHNERQKKRLRGLREDERDKAYIWIVDDSLDYLPNLCSFIGRCSRQIRAEVRSKYAQIRLKEPHTANLSH